MTATVLKPCNINGAPAEAGALVEVDSVTLANLSKKGVLAEYDGANTLQSADAADTSQPAEDGVSAVTQTRKRKPKTTN